MIYVMCEVEMRQNDLGKNQWLKNNNDNFKQLFRNTALKVFSIFQVDYK